MTKTKCLCLSTLLLFAVPALSQLSSPQAITGEYIVKFKNKTSMNRGLKLIGKAGADISVKSVFAGSQLLHIKVNSESERKALAADPEVAFIEPNYILSVNPIDLSSLGSPPSSTDDYTQSSANVQVKNSWAIQKPYNQGDKIVVAIIDTGLDRNHLLFKDSGSIWENLAEKNGTPSLDDDGNGLVDDINGWNYVNQSSNINDNNNHGTHVAGIVLGVGQDIFVSSVRESKIRIMALKFLDSTGSGTTSSAISAIEYAVNKGARVINNSWGGPSYSQSLDEAYAAAYNAGVVIVSAAGNSGTDNETTPMYPANFNTPSNISVLAATDTDTRASFSNYGATTVNVGAPGNSITSSVSGTGCIVPGCFQKMSGTSMAAPFVAGLAALALREAPQLSAYQIRSLILSSVDIIPALSGKVSTGGRVNAYKAIVEAKAQVATAPWAPSYSLASNRSPASVASNNGNAAGCGLVKAVDGVNNGGSGGAGAIVNILLLLMPLLVLGKLGTSSFLKDLV